MNGPIVKWPVAGGSGATVLVVEDNLEVRTMLVEMVEHLGYRGVPAANATEALSRLAALPRVDLLIADVMLPGGMNGVDLLEESRRRGFAFKSMLVSAFDLGEVRARTGVQPPTLLLRKPFSLDQLRAEITRLMATGTA